MKRLAAMLETLQALLLFAQTSVLFRIRGRRAVALATRRAMAVPPIANDAAEAMQDDLWRQARAVWRAKGIWPFEAKCLQTALVTHRLLLARGVAAPVRLGVDHADGQTRGHAWVEVGPYAVDDSQLQPNYIPFAVAEQAAPGPLGEVK